MRPTPLILSVIFGLVIVSCNNKAMAVPSPLPTPISTSSLDSLLSEQEAIKAALSIATHSQPEINATRVQPTNILARLSTLDQAMKEFSNSGSATGKSPTAPVWIITMEGEWREGFPFPTDQPTLQPYHHFFVILDAKSGEEISIGATY